MSGTIRKMITDTFPDVWPIVIIITVISCSLRIAYLIKNHEKFCFYREIFRLLFVVYVMCLFVVVTIQDDNYGLSNFIPFHEIFRYEIGSKLFVKNIIGNILLFLPYGYFTSDYLKSNKVSVICFLTLLVSVTIEIVQLYIGRTFDIDDCLLNTVGGALGFYLYSLIERIKMMLPSIFKKDGFANFFVILILILIIIYLSGWQVVSWVNVK